MYFCVDFEICNYMNCDSVVEDWDVVIKIWEYVFVNCLGIFCLILFSKNGLNNKFKLVVEGEDVEMVDEVDLDEMENYEKFMVENLLLMIEVVWNLLK